MADYPLAYLVTYRTYGTWLHGDPRGATDRHNNLYTSPWLPPDPSLHARRAASLITAPVHLDAHHRSVVEATLREVAIHRDWTLHAVNARSNHVHAVVTAPLPPEKVLATMKSWSTRRLLERTELAKPVWSHHGSTRYLWNTDQLARAHHYVLREQD